MFETTDVSSEETFLKEVSRLAPLYGSILSRTEDPTSFARKYRAKAVEELRRVHEKMRASAGPVWKQRLRSCCHTHLEALVATPFSLQKAAEAITYIDRTLFDAHLCLGF